jgi:hypothetical protein
VPALVVPAVSEVQEVSEPEALEQQVSFPPAAVEARLVLEVGAVPQLLAAFG